MRSRRILLVEDNATDEILTMRALRRCGVATDIIVAHDGAEALDYLFASGAHAARDPHDLPVLVVLDLKLPRIDGLGVLARIRGEAITRYLPVVVLTSSDEQQDIRACYSAGANSYVRKPVDSEHFAETVERLCRYWLLSNERVSPGHAE